MEKLLIQEQLTVKRAFPEAELVIFRIADYDYLVNEDAEVVSQMLGVGAFDVDGVRVLMLDNSHRVALAQKLLHTKRAALCKLNSPVYAEQFEQYITKWKSFTSR